MAILRNGINGGFSGKVGSVVGTIQYGKCILRGVTAPSKKNKIGSKEQNKNRSKLKQVHALLAPMLKFVRVGFNKEGIAKEISAYNAAKSYNMLHAFDEQLQLDYSKIRLTSGDLPDVDNLTVASDDIGFHFTWTPNPTNDWEREYDQVMIMAYNEETKMQHAIFSGARRKAGLETLSMEGAKKGQSFHIWVSFIADDRDRISTSVYMGNVIFGGE